jgi:hypothetical protein
MGWTGLFPAGQSAKSVTRDEQGLMDTTPALASIGIDIGKDIFHLVDFDTAQRSLCQSRSAPAWP